MKDIRKTKKGSAILLVVAGMVFLMILAAVLLVSTKERDLAAHNLAFERACHEIALSTANVTFLAFKRSLILQEQWEPTQKKSENDLLSFLFKNNKKLIKDLDKLHDGGHDQLDELKKLLGEQFLSPIEQGVLPFYKGAKVQVALHIIPIPLFEAIGGSEDYFDPFERNFRVTICAQASWQDVERTVVLTKEARVNSLLPPATSKFVFLCRQPKSSEFNSRLCSSEGVSVDEGIEPLWRIFANEDGESLRQELERKSQSQGQSQWSADVVQWQQLVGELSLPKLQEEYKDSGFIYFGKPVFAARTVLKLPAGEEDHLLSCAHFPQEERHRAKEAPKQPERMEAISTTKRPFVQGLFAGFHDQTMATGLFGPSLTDDQSSRLQLFGSQDSPCPTLVIGDVLAGCARVTDMAIDRDREMTDEEEQRNLLGTYLPQRETIDPFFVCANIDEFSLAVSRESSYPLQLGALKPFCSPSLIGEAINRTPEDEVVRFGLLENLNLHADSNGDGSPDRVLACEVAHNPMVIPLAEYGYGKLFSGWDEYCTYASTGKEQFSFNLLAKTLSMEPKVAFNALWENRLLEPQALVGSEEARITATGTATEEELKLHFSTKLHERAEAGPLFDNKRNVNDGLAKLPVEDMLRARAVVAMTMKELQERLMSGTEKDFKRDLDLRGLTINLVGSFELEPWKRKRGPLTVTVRKRYGLQNHMRPEANKGGKKEYWLNGGGAILAGGVSLGDVVITNEDGDKETPLFIRGNNVNMRVPFYLDAMVDGQQLFISDALHRQAKDSPPQQINGGLHIGNSAALGGSFALDINYEKRYDPTSETMAAHYRGFVSDSVYGWLYGRQSFNELWSTVRLTWNEQDALREEEEKCKKD